MRWACVTGSFQQRGNPLLPTIRVQPRVRPEFRHECLTAGDRYPIDRDMDLVQDTQRHVLVVLVFHQRLILVIDQQGS